MKKKRFAEGGTPAAEPKKSNNFRNFLGTVSPLFGALTGEGVLFGRRDPQTLARRKFKLRPDGTEMTEAEERAALVAEGGKPPMTMRSGGKVSSASSRGDGIAQRGKTKGRNC